MWKEPAMYRAILVPLDGSEFGQQALPVALSIAQRVGARVRLAHVQAGEDAGARALVSSPTPVDTQVQATERIYLEQLAQRLASRYPVHVEHILLDGPVADALADQARASGADLVVMSTHGRGALGRVWLGSVAVALARLAPVPVLLVRPQQPLMPSLPELVFRHILIPLDGSPLAEQAIEPAVALGTLMDARYTLFQALDPLIIQHTHPPYTVGLAPQLSAEVQTSAAAYLERMAARLRAQSLDVDTSLAVGPPALNICGYAQAHAVDLIAMATHGHGGIARLFLGSVANLVLQTAAVPVLLSRPSAKPGEASRV
jgi:nucleotide-binding universal stress UspA family protein